MEIYNLKSIERYINDEANETEKEYVEALFAEGQGNDSLRDLLEKDWCSDLKNTETEFDKKRLLITIHQAIIKNDLQRRERPIKKVIRLYMKAAAMLLLPIILAGSLFIFQLKHESVYAENTSSLYNIYAPLGSRVSFTLPDGTTGMLNGGSRLDYSVPFETRKVNISGEAWFVVHHDEAHPFIINANNSKIEVLGTKLNVSAYKEEKYVEVVLQEGKVDFYRENTTEKVSMRPSERIIFHEGEMKKSVVDTSKYTSWTQGKLIFRGDSMPEVARRIERWYNVKVIIADKELEKYSFRATFQDDNVEEVIRCLSLTSPISYRISPRKLSVNGVYQKAEVVIFKSR